MPIRSEDEELIRVLDELVAANRILARENVVDGYGHVSVRHPFRPDRFFLSASRSPEFVAREDLIEFDLAANPIDLAGRSMYAERPIHAGIYAERADVMAVVHNHAHEVLPFTITSTTLRPLVHVAGIIGRDIPVWDIADRWPNSDMLVRTLEQGVDLARRLGAGRCVLMRGHGSAVASSSLKEAVLTAIYLLTNAKLQLIAMPLGEIHYLSDGEIEATAKMMASPVSLDRVWEYWCRRALVT